MECIKCGEVIPSNDCLCDIHEMVGCGCSIQPPNEVFLPDPNGGDDIGPFCQACAERNI